jgi:hypothetical protein
LAKKPIPIPEWIHISSGVASEQEHITLSAPLLIKRGGSEVRLVLENGDERVQDGMFSYVTLEPRVPQDHPLREIRRLTDVVLRSLSAEFDEMYSASRRPSIAPECALRRLLL